jgi:hypothetical protein
VLKVKGITPTAGPSTGGEAIEIVGAGYVENVTQVFFGDEQVDPANIEFVSTVRLVVTLPPSAGVLGRVDVSARNPGTAGDEDEVATLRNAFVYYADSLAFDTYTNFVTPESPVAGTVADINGDARPDILLSHRGDTSGVSTLLNLGSGRFRSESFLGLRGTGRPEAPGVPALRPNLLTAARLDPGIFTDFAVTVFSEAGPDLMEPEFLTFSGRGDGTFRDGVGFRSGDFPPSGGPDASGDRTLAPTGIAVGDFDEDGHNDVLVVYSASDNVAVFFSDGAGGYSGTTVLPAGGRPVAATVADLNGDQHLDFAVTNSRDGTVSVYYGLGNTRFREAVDSPFLSGSTPLAVDSGFFDDDSIRDLVVVNSRSDTVSILRGDGFGGFDDPVGFQTGRTPTSVLASDLDLDGSTDFAVANSQSDSVTIFLQRSGGDFLEESFFTGSVPQSLLVANFDGDANGFPDLVAVNNGGDSVSFHRNLGDAVFNQPVLLGTNGRGDIELSSPLFFEDPVRVESGDFDGDGIEDTVTADAGRSGVLFVPGSADGRLLDLDSRFSPLTLPPAAFDAGDLDGDGRLDLAVVHGAAGSVTLLHGTGQGTFVEEILGDRTLFGQADDVAIADVDGDDDLDIVLLANNLPRIVVFPNDGTGRFSPRRTSPLPFAPGSLATGDWNDDGRADLAVPAVGEPAFAALLARPDATFELVSLVTTEVAPSSLAAADWNDDSLLDLAVHLPQIREVRIYGGNGGGSFFPEREFDSVVDLEGIFAVELNGDSLVDLTGMDTSGNALLLFRNLGPEGFADPLVLGTAAGPVDVAAYRPGDGQFVLPDLIVVNRSAANLAHLRNGSF